ncbi:hypothetical protein ACHAXR_009305, partial [Thalassiosira sp. AJA248-18]
MIMMATTSSNKRTKTAHCSLHITALPESVLEHLSAYLSKPSRAMFAVAMTAPSESWAKSNCERQPSSASKAIISSSSEKWDHLDFLDIEKGLARGLSDNDLCGILVCIDAVSKLKRLKLTGCVNITGHGLEPLSDSTVLEQIDLSLVGQHKTPVIYPEPLISEEAVFPILHSILDAEDSSLKSMQLPK